MKKNIEVVREKKLCNNLIMIDGFSGSGKSFIMPLISHLEDAELWQISMHTERVCILEYLKKIDRESALTLIKMSFDERLYDLQLSRNVNFRASDDSSVQNNLLFEKYNKRMNDPTEHKEIVRRIEEKNPLLVMDVHYMFGYSDLYFRGLYDRLSVYLIMLRNPAHLVRAYFNQNIHKRILEDKMELTLCTKIDGKIVPYYAVDFYEDYLSANDLEKTILFVYYHTKKSKDMYDSLRVEEKSKIVYVPFEKVSVNPDFYINKIVELSGKKRGEEFSKIYEYLNLPREEELVDYEIINNLKNQHNINVDVKYEEMITTIIEEYKIILKKY